MRIGFDAKRAAANFTGLGNYSRSLIENLQKFYPEGSYFLYTPVFKKTNETEVLLQNPNTHLRMPTYLGKYFKSFWRSVGVCLTIKKDKLKIYHGLSGELPLIKTKETSYILTVHDLIFLRFPAYYKVLDRIIYRIKLRLATAAADKIIAISEQTKEDLISFLHVPTEKIKVIYQSCSPRFNLKFPKDEHIRIRKQYLLPEKYILCVATLEIRKNQLQLLKALAIVNSISNEKVNLVLVGRKTSYYNILENFIIENSLQSHVHFLQQIPSTDIPLIFQNALIFVYPSRFEGFGIPIIEALFSGVPVICSTGSCFSEAGGPDTIYIEPDDYQSLSSSILNLINNEEKRNEMIARGRTFAQNFLPQKLSEQLIKVYENAGDKL